MTEQNPKGKMHMFSLRPSSPKWQTMQQVLRVVAYSIGGMLLGDSVADSDAFQAAVGGFVSIVAFGWWWYWEINRPADAASELVVAPEVAPAPVPEEGTTTVTTTTTKEPPEEPETTKEKPK